MKHLNHKILPLDKAIEYITFGLDNEKYSIELCSEAPKWLKFISRGGYCAYGNTIYVPLFHLELVASKFDEDRTLGTAKLLPWIMLVRDNKEKISRLTAIKALFTLSYQLHYFSYEFLFLFATNHPFKDTIGLGFMTSRRGVFGKKIPVKTIKENLQDILKNSIIIN